jgi:hypothetical protein
MPDDIFPKCLYPATLQFIVATCHFSYPKSAFFCHFVPAISTSAYIKKHSDEVANAHRTATSTNTTPNATQQQQQRIRCSSNNDPQSLTQSKAENGNNQPKNVC